MDRLRLYVYKTAHVPKRQFEISKAMLSYSNKHKSDINSTCKSVLRVLCIRPNVSSKETAVLRVEKFIYHL